ncbi:MAG: hypothetical protein OXK76_06830 [Gammaproteobacteria bacterium]|nr:hypothetical protein [Gammaproteobacteria bacterium]
MRRIQQASPASGTATTNAIEEPTVRESDARIDAQKAGSQWQIDILIP